MALSTDLEILNRALRDVSSCFLQYVGECWPWASAGADGEKLRAAVMACVSRQRGSIQRLAEHLSLRQSRVELGRFSNEFTDLHFVSLKFLLKRLVESQTALVESLDRAASLLPSGDATHELLATANRNEHDNLAALKQLSASP